MKVWQKSYVKFYFGGMTLKMFYSISVQTLIADDIIMHSVEKQSTPCGKTSHQGTDKEQSEHKAHRAKRSSKTYRSHRTGHQKWRDHTKWNTLTPDVRKKTRKSDKLTLIPTKNNYLLKFPTTTWVFEDKTPTRDILKLRQLKRRY